MGPVKNEAPTGKENTAVSSRDGVWEEGDWNISAIYWPTVYNSCYAFRFISKLHTDLETRAFLITA